MYERGCIGGGRGKCRGGRAEEGEGGGGDIEKYRESRANMSIS